jgi:hypothetical protein
MSGKQPGVAASATAAATSGNDDVVS